MPRETTLFEVFAIVHRRELPTARVLAASCAAHHPGTVLRVLVVDGPPDAAQVAAGAPIRTLPWAALGTDPADFHRLAAICEPAELAAALRPHVFRHLLDEGAAAVIGLDPAAELFAPIGDLAELARCHDVVLVPRRMTPGADSPPPGVFDSGCLALGQGARPMVEAWCGARPGGYPGAWLDGVPAWFQHHVLRDPGYGVAWWNLDERTVRRRGDGGRGDGWEVDGKPLRLFHFRGFDPARPYLLSPLECREPRILLSERPPLAQLCAGRAERLLAHGFAEHAAPSSAFAMTADGLPVDGRVRRLCRQALAGAKSGQEAFPDPFDAARAGELTAWLASLDPASPLLVSRYAYAVYQDHPELWTLFTDLAAPEDVERFHEWIRAWGDVIVPPVPAPLRPVAPTPAPVPRPASEALRPGVNLVGYVKAESGVGEIGRLLAATLAAAGVPYGVLPFTETLSRQEHPFEVTGEGRPVYDVNLICVNADQLPVFARRAGRQLFEGRYSIGVWAWEVDPLPASMRGSAELVDEVWGISHHTADAVAPYVDRPVRAFPLPICPPSPAVLGRARLGLPEGFLFLFCFDFDSVFERKNPLALVAAYGRAFAPGEARLVIKSINGDRHLEELERLRAAAAGRPDVEIRDGYLAAEEQSSLIAACDAYVSLHRAEGFGLTLAEAMARGKPVIATGYSANLDFMDEDNGYLVPYRLIPIPPGCGPYPPEGRWAEPDVEAAAAHLRRVFERPEEARARGERARRDVGQRHGPEARAPWLRERLAAVRAPSPRTPSGAAETPAKGGWKALLARAAGRRNRTER